MGPIQAIDLCLRYNDMNTTRTKRLALKFVPASGLECLKDSLANLFDTANPLDARESPLAAGLHVLLVIMNEWFGLIVIDLQPFTHGFLTVVIPLHQRFTCLIILVEHAGWIELDVVAAS